MSNTSRHSLTLVPGARPYVGVHVIVRTGRHQGAAGTVIQYARSKFARPARHSDTDDGITNYYVVVRPEFGTVFTVSAAHVDVYERTGR